MNQWKKRFLVLCMAIMSIGFMLPVNAYADIVTEPIVDSDSTTLVIFGVAIVAIAIAAFVLIRRNRKRN